MAVELELELPVGAAEVVTSREAVAWDEALAPALALEPALAELLTLPVACTLGETLAV